jgi:hypothetical protein
MRCIRLALTAVVLCSFSQPAIAQQANTSTREAVATRAPQTPSIDGRGDDVVWQRAQKYSDFRQFEPRVDSAPSFKTEFQVGYDEKNLYVFVRMFDPHPDSIMRALSRRDVRGPSDQVKLLIDSYDDKRTGYEFAVNPDGVKRDFVISNDGNEDGSWDGIWDVGTQVDSLGWTAEFRIPLSQLRYARASSQSWGFGIWRDIERYRERVSWPLWRPTVSGLSSQLGRLNGLEGLTTARRLEVTPYTVAKNIQRSLPNSQYERVQEITGGADLKFGITPNVTLDATVNPDFGQVEADPAVVNLTAFETFYAERRPFFVEGTSLYEFPLNCYIVVDCNTNEGLFYSRRIGRAPSLAPLYGDVTTPTATSIIAASKLTGRTKGGLSFGFLDAFTEEVASSSDRTVEPLSNYAVLRTQQDFRGGEAAISLIGTAVNRSMDEFTSPFLHKNAYAAGATFRNRFGNKNYEVAGQFAASIVNGTQAVIYRTQLSPVHYYQQPGDDLEVDSSRTSLTGTTAQIKFGKYGGGITRFETSLVRQSAGFEVNDMGYQRRADILDWSTWASLQFREARGIYRWAGFNANHWEHWNTSGARLENAFNFNGHMGFNNNWDAHAGATLGAVTESYCDRCTRGGPLLRKSPGFYPWGGVNTDSRKVVSGGIWFNGRLTDEGKSHGGGFDPYINFRFSTRLGVSVGFGYYVDHNNTQWFGNITDTVGTHYTFAHLNQRTVSASARVNYTFTPNLTFEFYGQPFVSTGSYTDVRETSATPDADKYDDRFDPFAPPPNAQMSFKYTQLRTNAVVRWEYRPGSTVFVVWQHGRQDASNHKPGQSWTQDYRDLFGLHPDNTFLVKVAYWLSR